MFDFKKLSKVMFEDTRQYYLSKRKKEAYFNDYYLIY